MNFDITKRLREPPFGTETSERLLMAQAADKIDALRQDNDRLEEENGELRYEPWPKWAKAVLAITRKRSGYDGYDDASDGVDLPAELEECFCELEAEDEKQRKLIDTLRAENEQLRAENEKHTREYDAYATALSRAFDNWKDAVARAEAAEAALSEAQP